MGSDVYANSRMIVHKKDGGTQVAGVPDVCKTPSPAGPVPVPYPNLAQSSDLAKGSKKTKIHKAPIALESSNLSKSGGDEAGTVGGVISNVNRGKLKFAMYSMDVKVEGKGVVRFGDPGPGNGNSGNDLYPVMMGDVHTIAMGDDSSDDECERCGENQATHRMLIHQSAQDACMQFLEKVECTIKDVVDRRRNYLQNCTTKLRGGTIADPCAIYLIPKANGRTGKHEAYLSALTTDAGTLFYPKDDMPVLLPLFDALERLWDAVQAELEALEVFSTGKYLHGKKMFGVTLCNCCDPERKRDNGHAFAAVSGTGSSPTVVVAQMDVAGIERLASTAAAAANGLGAAIAATEAYIAKKPKDKQAKLALTAFKALREKALEIVALDDAEQVLVHESAKSKATLCGELTLAQTVKESIDSFNADPGKRYTWHMPDEPNLGPPAPDSMKAVSGGSVVNMGSYTMTDAAGRACGPRTATKVSWPEADYGWDNSEDNGSLTPFTCAAPKSVQLCYNKGHIPWSLCELYYQGRGASPVPTNPRMYSGPSTTDKDEATQLSNQSANYTRAENEKVKHKEVAYHCDTCRELIPKMLCYKETADCS